MASQFGSFGAALGKIASGGSVGAAPSIPIGSGQVYGKQCSSIFKKLVMAGSATTNMVTVTGQGVMTRIFLAIQADSNAINGTLVKIYVDGETTPSVSCPTNLMFQAAYYPSFNSDLLGSSVKNGNTFGGYLYIKAPFKTSLRIDVVNGSTTSATFWGFAQYALGGSYNWGPYGKLRNVLTGSSGVNGATVPVAKLAEFNLLNYTGGPGVLHGINFLVNCAGTDVNSMEGLLQAYVDGETTASFQSSGTEDYFGGEFFFQAGTFATRQQGCTYIGATGGSAPSGATTMSGYRFHVDDPLVFNTGMRFTWTNGNASVSNQPSGNATFLANVWYYTAN